MTTQREAAQLALNALHLWHWTKETTGLDAAHDALRDALVDDALRNAQVEPVAWMVYTLDGKSAFVTDNPADFTQDHRALPLYTQPPQRKPLTDAEIFGLYESTSFDWVQGKSSKGIEVLFARAIERAHGIGEKE